MSRALVGLIFVAFTIGNGLAAEVDSEVSTRETFVGLPIVLRINVNNASEHETPIMPDVDGLRIESAGPPSRQSRTMWINNRKTNRTTVSYAYRVTPLREGTFTIPPVKVEADGLSSLTKPVRVVAAKSETDDLMFVEISASDSSVYVGQQLDLTLRIWIRPYRDQQFRVELDEADMWQLISKQTSWGPFQEQMENLAQSNRRPGGRSVLRKDSTGQERQYLLYEIETTIYPDRPVNLDGEDVQIIVSYPLELGRSRGPFSMIDDDFFGGSPFNDNLFRSFGSRLAITKQRPIVGEARFDPITVKPVPTAGRPSDYVGAVGKYDIYTGATPQTIQVGDPITLQLAIEGTGSMEVVRAPPLPLQQDLIEDFRVPNEPLAGTINGSTKNFTTTIRPRNVEVKQIPPIEYSYFDPEREEFVRVKSDPIEIEVKPAEVLALDSIVGNRGDRQGSSVNPSADQSVATPQAFVFSGDHVLVSSAPQSMWTTPVLAAVCLPPMMFFLAVLYRLRFIPGLLIPARRRLQSDLKSATTGEEVATALESFLSSKFQLEEGRRTRAQTIGALRAIGRQDIAIRAERIYQGVDQFVRPNRPGQKVTPLPADDVEDLKTEALEIANEVSHARSQPRLQSASLSKNAALGLATALAFCLSASSEVTATELNLSVDQQEQLLQEGNELFQTASSNPDTVEAKEQFEEAKNRFQLLVDSGIANDRLFFNLAESQAKCGLLGASIANYRRALRLAPTEQLYHDRLQRVSEQRESPRPQQAGALVTAERFNDAVLRFISPGTILFGFAAAWLAFWVSLAIGIAKRGATWKLPAAAALTFAVIFGGSYWMRVRPYTKDAIAIVTQKDVIIRSGDGESFKELARLTGREGDELAVLKRREGWIRVRLPSGREGWIAESDAIPI